MRSKVPLAILGAGRAGIGLGRRLHRRGYRVTGIVSRGRASQIRGASLLGLAGSRAGRASLQSAVQSAKVVLICVPDGEIPAVVDALSALPAPGLRGKTVLHTSGALSSAPLEPLRACGAEIGCIHPLVSFPSPGRTPVSLKGVSFAVEGDRAALRAARAMARAVGGVPISVPAPARAAYHLAASLLANHLVALLEAGLDLAARSLEIKEAAARKTFLPLVRSALDNVSRYGTRRALTGPVARGDLATLARHLETLEGQDPHLRDLYRLLAHRAVMMAEADGRIGSTKAGRMLRMLGFD